MKHTSFSFEGGMFGGSSNAFGSASQSSILDGHPTAPNVTTTTASSLFPPVLGGSTQLQTSVAASSSGPFDSASTAGNLLFGKPTPGDHTQGTSSIADRAPLISPGFGLKTQAFHQSGSTDPTQTTQKGTPGTGKRGSFLLIGIIELE